MKKIKTSELKHLGHLIVMIGAVLVPFHAQADLPATASFWTPFGAFCGDGVIQPKIATGDPDAPYLREQCDDGGNENGDGCSSICQLERIGTPLKENKNQDSAIPLKLFIQEQQRTYEIPLVTAMDNAGNVAIYNELQTLNIKIDKTPPEFSPVVCTAGMETFDNTGISQGVQPFLAYPTESLFSQEGRQQWTNQNITCSYSVDDPNYEYNSKLKTWWNTLSPDTTKPTPTGEVQYWDIVDFGGVRTEDVATGAVTSTVTTIDPGLDGSMMEEGEIRSEYTFNIEQEAYYIYSGQAQDHAGNGSPLMEEPFVVKIDKTPPLFSSTGIQLSNGGGIRTLSSTTREVFEANEEFEIYLNVIDPEVAGAASGINLQRSFITLTYETDPTLSLSAALSSGEIEFRSVVDPATVKNLTEPIVISDDSDLFEKAGDYKLSVIIRDRAENILVSEQLLIEIVASEVDEGTSTMFIDGACLGESHEAGGYVETTSITTGTDCELGKLYANNSDVCSLKIELRDRFENLIVDRPVNMSFRGQELNQTEYDLIDSAEQGFINGIRFEGGGDISPEQELTFNTNTTDATQEFSIRSLVPTVEVVPTNNTEVFCLFLNLKSINR